MRQRARTRLGVAAIFPCFAISRKKKNGRKLQIMDMVERGWIRTSVRLRGQIYSLLPLTTRPPLQGRQARHMAARLRCVNALRRSTCQLPLHRRQSRHPDRRLPVSSGARRRGSLRAPSPQVAMERRNAARSRSAGMNVASRSRSSVSEAHPRLSLLARIGAMGPM